MSFPQRNLLRGSGPVAEADSSRLRSSEADAVNVSDHNRCGASGLAEVHLVGWEALMRAMSSRLVARAAARSSSRSASCRPRSMTCCSSRVICWWRASMSAGAPSPESRQACSPRASESRCSRCWTRVWSRAARSWAASRSACSEARVTAGPARSLVAGGSAARAWILLEQVAVAVEEAAVDPGGAGDGGHADLGAVGGAAVERGEDALAAARAVGVAAVAHRLGPAARRCGRGGVRAAGDGGGVHAVASGAVSGRAGAAARTVGRPSGTGWAARWRRTTATASSIWARSAGVESGDVTVDAVDQPSDPGDLLGGGGGVGAGPLVDPVDGGGEPFAGAQQVVEVGGQVGQVGDVGAEVVAAGAAEPDRAGAAAGLDVGRFGAAAVGDGDVADGVAGVLGVQQGVGVAPDPVAVPVEAAARSPCRRRRGGGAPRPGSSRRVTSRLR